MQKNTSVDTLQSYLPQRQFVHEAPPKYVKKKTFGVILIPHGSCKA